MKGLGGRALVDIIKFPCGGMKCPQCIGVEVAGPDLMETVSPAVHDDPACIVMRGRRLVRAHGSERVVHVRDLYDRSFEGDRIPAQPRWITAPVPALMV